MPKNRVRALAKIIVTVGLGELVCLGLWSGLAEAQGPTPTPGVTPTLTPVPSAWYEGDKAPWILALIVVPILTGLAGIFLRPTFEEWGKAFQRWLKELGFNFEKNYRNALSEKYRYLKFVGVRDRTKAGRPKLEDVYISLQMGAPGQIESDAQPTELALGDALRAHKNLVILGEPGVGKSTLLRYLVLVFAGVVPVARLGLNEKRVPIYVRLKDCVGNDTPISELVAVPPTLPMLKSPAGFFEQRLRRGQCLVMLDGLDEVVSDAQKKIVAEKIAQLVGEYAQNRFVVTCRTAGWDSQLLPGNFAALKIRDLNTAQVTRFIHDWYKAVITNEKLLTAGADPEKQELAKHDAASEARKPADDLVTRLETHEGLARLSKNPLILSLIALVHFSRQYILPQRRAELYKDCLDILLDQWDRGEHELVFADAPSLEVKHELAQAIACHFQSHGVDEASENELTDLLAPILQTRECKVSPQDCLRVQIVERSGLLVERAIGRYGFAHRTLQEYLAAKRYADAPNLREELFRHLHDEAWREVILLFIGLANPDVATQTVRDILAQPDDAAHNLLLLAGQCLAENGKIERAAREDCLTRLQAVFHATTEPLAFIRLATTLAGIGGADVAQYFETVLGNSNANVRIVAAQALGALGKRIAPARIATTLLTALKDDDARVRCAAIISLGQLGHAAREVIKPLHALRSDADLTMRAAAVSALLKLGHANELGLRQVPAGEFLMGSDEGDDEKPPHTVYLDEYFIGRNPVTNAEYKKFVDATKHRAPFYGWENDRIPAGKENHPVVGVTWEDAIEYCQWSGVRLPTEAEWEKAARGTDARRYPWGNTFDASRCNSAESRQGARGVFVWIARVLRRPDDEGATTPVGQYSPRGDSPYGCADMAGNVWEWCADWYDQNYYKNSPAQNPVGPDSGGSRVLRGGAFGNNQYVVRAAFRLSLRASPVYRGRDYGFRVAAGAS